ncbi:unnamed protein product [marine sediment metagenome]|uniref:HTH merR-type domain-containing protein n=1 Tax=marine sediment metagenome TaxID=412755 RepID=X1V3Y6_9ZZZZ
MPTPKLKLAFKYLTATQARKRLGLSRYQFDHRIELGIFPQPSYIDETGIQYVRYFDENWVRVAQTILDNAAGGNK